VAIALTRGDGSGGGGGSPAAGSAPAASAAPPSAAPATAAASSAPAAATKHVSILNQDMTDDQIKAEVAKEGSLVVANWTYTANDELVKEFKAYVKDNYGADVDFTYEGSQAPSVYL